MSTFNLGGLISAFAPGKTQQRYYSNPLQTQINTSIDGMDAFRGAQDADLGRFSGAIQSAASQIDQLGPQDMRLIDSLIRQYSGSPIDQYRQVGDMNMGWIDRMAGSIAGQGRGAMNQSMARLGYGGRGGSTFEQNTLLDRISRNLAPVYGNIMGNVGRDAQMLEGAGSNRIGDTLNLINSRSNIPLRTADLYLAPSQARQANLMGQLLALGGMGDLTRANTAGFEYRPNKWAAAAGAVDSSMNATLDNTMGLASGAMGMLGGGGGIMGGGMA